MFNFISNIVKTKFVHGLLMALLSAIIGGLYPVITAWLGGQSDVTLAICLSIAWKSGLGGLLAYLMKNGIGGTGIAVKCLIIAIMVAGLNHSVSAQTTDTTKLHRSQVNSLWNGRAVPPPKQDTETWNSFFNFKDDSLNEINAGISGNPFSFIWINFNHHLIPSSLLGSQTGDSLSFHGGQTTFNPLIISSRLDMSNPMNPQMINGLTNNSSILKSDFIVQGQGIINTHFLQAALGLNLFDTLDFRSNLASGRFKFPNFSGTIAVTNISNPSSADTARLHGGTNAHCYGVSSDTIMAKPNAWMTVKGSDGVTYKLPLYKQ